MNNKTEKPATPRTDVAPTVGYVLSVDRKSKTQFELSEDAMAAALRLNKPTRCFRSKCLMRRTATQRWRHQKIR